MKKLKFGWIDILIIILFILSVYFILTRIFGQSATDLIIAISLFTFLGSILLKMMHIVFNLNREFGEFKIRTINAFERLKDDIKIIKNKVKK